MTKFAIFLAVTALPMTWAQQQPADPPPAVTNASISGVVRNKNTGAPLKDYTISTYVNATWSGNSITMTATTKQVVAKTDEQGHYRLSDLPPAQYRIAMQGPEGFFGATSNRTVVLAGQDVDGIDFNAIVPATISGKVIDENGDGVPNMMVTLVSKEYYLGSIGYYHGGGALTNDLGEYTLANVKSGHTYYLIAQPWRRHEGAHAETPLNPAMRRRTVMRTWYPSSPDKDGAAPLLLRDSESREGVNIEVKKSPSYCLSGVAMTPNGPAALNLDVELLSPSNGTSSSGGSFGPTPGATTGSNGEFRLCDFAPGSYRVSVSETARAPESTFATTIVNISDRDVTDLRIPTSPRVSMDAEIVLEGEAHKDPFPMALRFNLMPMFRTQQPGEKAGGRADVPGTLQLTGLTWDDYSIYATVNTQGLYIKDITYGARSVFHQPVRVGSEGGSVPLHVILAQDGGRITTRVVNKDDHPVSGTTVIVMPEGAQSEADLAALITSGQTDQAGQYKSGFLAPGKYYVVATEDSYDMTPESIGKLWQSHNRFKEVDLPASGSVQVDLQPTGIR
ncbi:MAG TPA: carboxypeptidase-like regulatory domain-containing protein [Bryobacteraceae bacterium]